MYNPIRWMGICILLGTVMPAMAVDAETWQRVLERDQYKRFHVAVLETALEGDWAAALAQALTLEERLKDDPETALILAAIHAHSGRNAEALAWCTTARSRGLAAGRLAAEANNLLAPLAEDARFIEMLDVALVHGPMLGHLTDAGVSVWVRTATATEVELIVGSEDNPRHAAATTREEDDYTAVLRVEGLEPATNYTYRIRVGGTMLEQPEWRLRTADPNARTVRLAFGGGAGYTPVNERMWSTIGNENPDLLLLLGDNVYIDNPTHPEIQRYCYYRRHSRPEFRRLVCTTPVYAIWDDHDFGVNDCWYGSDPDQPAWKRDVLRVFQQNWVNPSYGGGAETPGVWFAFDREPIRVIMTDGRYYRSNPEETPRTMLGDAQKSWLLETLRKPAQPFTFIVSGVPWTPGTKGESPDTWDGYPEEREEIFQALEAAPLENVLLLSADRHRSDILRIERPSGDGFVEFESSRLTNKHVHDTLEQAIFSYNELQSFGLIEGALDGDTKGLKLTIVNIDGEKVYTMHVPRD